MVAGLGKTEALGPGVPAVGRMGRASLWPRLGLACTALVAVSLIALAMGPADVSLAATVRILASHLPGVGISEEVSPAWRNIIWEVRLPRVLLAGVVGAALAMSGATYQGVFRNPLADPYLIGVATGASLGATIVVVSDARRLGVRAERAAAGGVRGGADLGRGRVRRGAGGWHGAGDDVDPGGRSGVLAGDGDHRVPDAEEHDESR